MPAGGGSSPPLPGGLGIMSAGTTTGARGASLDWDRPARVTPAERREVSAPRLGRALRTKRSAKSQETWPDAEPWGGALPLARTVVERREASAPAGALPRPLTLSRKRARARGNGAEDGLRVSRRSASFHLRMILSENRIPLFGIMRTGSEPKRTSSPELGCNETEGIVRAC